MAKVIYPIEVYDKQENGTIFYKEGILNDEMRSVGPGILESWRYNFSAGKQVFRATGEGANEGVIYEKRLARDESGNPYWTNWIEIPRGEANGIQAIAVNAGPLRLPNEDGAIKLEITPELLGVFTKSEAAGLIDSKLAQHWSDTHQYFEWPITVDPEYSWTHVQALSYLAEQLYSVPEGMEGTLYTLSPKRHVDDFATQWLWNSKDGKYQWIQISGGDALEAWVSQREFDTHNNDQVRHITADERAYWNAREADYDEKISDSITKAEEELSAHIDDLIIHVTQADKDAWYAMTPQVQHDALKAAFEAHDTDAQAIQGDILNRSKLRHVDSQDRAKWDAKMDGRMPDKDKRYVARLDQWFKAFEQVNILAEEKSKIVFREGGTFNVTTQQFMIPYKNDLDLGSFGAEFNTLFGVEKAVIDRVTLTMSAFNTFGISGFFYTEDLNRRSERFNTKLSSDPFVWEMGPTPFTNLYVEFDAPLTQVKPNLGGITITAYYRIMDMVQLGDEDNLLPVNIIGSPLHSLMYNGKPLDGIGSTLWGEIAGKIIDQADLTKYIADSVKDRLNVPTTVDGYHWLLTEGDLWTKALIQPGGVETKPEVISMSNTGFVSSGDIVIPTSTLTDLYTAGKTGGYSLLSTKIEMKRVSSDSTSEGIYFEALRADGTLINRSPTIEADSVMAYFEWAIPLEEIHRIVVKARKTHAVYAVRFIDGITITGTFSRYTHVEAGLRDKMIDILAKKDGKFDDVRINDVQLSKYFLRLLTAEEAPQELNHASRKWLWNGPSYDRRPNPFAI
jgi:hypothetical protein